MLIGDVATGALTVVDRSDAGRTEDLAWSPDGAWLAYSFWTDARTPRSSSTTSRAARQRWSRSPSSATTRPSFDPDGRYLYFLSVRTFDPVYDSVQFELSFPRAARPYLIALQAGGRPPFDPEPKGSKPDDAGTRAGAQADRRPRRRRSTSTASRGASRAFPVPEDRFGQIAGVAGGKVLWTVLPIVGAHGRGGHKEAPGRLEVFDFATLRAETLLDRVDAFALAADALTLVVRDGKRLRAHRREPQARAERDAAAQSDAPSRKSGWIDLDRIRVSVEPRREWRQMLREVWRLQRDQFWVARHVGRRLGRGLRPLRAAARRASPRAASSPT